MLIQLLMVTAAFADTHCLDENTYQDTVKVVANYSCMQTTHPKISAGNYSIIVDKSGRIFSGDGTTDGYIDGSIDWCTFHIPYRTRPVMQLYTRAEPEYGFRLRYKAYLYVKAIHFIDDYNKVPDGGVGLDFLYYHDFNLQIFVGIASFGGGIGWDVTKNFGVLGAATLDYFGFVVSPTVGIYFSFN
jgi:hypothetical protein